MTRQTVLAHRLVGEEVRRAYADTLKWQAVQDALVGAVLSSEHYGSPDNMALEPLEHPKQEPPQPKLPAPQNRRERRAERKRLGQFKRRGRIA